MIKIKQILLFLLWKLLKLILLRHTNITITSVSGCAEFPLDLILPWHKEL